jgi:hypothetical protein
MVTVAEAVDHENPRAWDNNDTDINTEAPTLLGLEGWM